jgi:hypothetical protein
VLAFSSVWQNAGHKWKEGKVYSVYGFTGVSPPWLEDVLEHSSTHYGSRMEQQGKEPGKDIVPKATPTVTSFLQLGPSYQIFRLSQNSTTSWGPSAQNISLWGTFCIQTITPVYYVYNCKPFSALLFLYTTWYMPNLFGGSLCYHLTVNSIRTGI